MAKGKESRLYREKKGQEQPPIESSSMVSFEKPKSPRLALKLLISVFQYIDFGFHRANKKKRTPPVNCGVFLLFVLFSH